MAEEGDKPPDATKIGWSFFWQTPGSLLPFVMLITLHSFAVRVAVADLSLVLQLTRRCAKLSVVYTFHSILLLFLG